MSRRAEGAAAENRLRELLVANVKPVHARLRRNALDALAAHLASTLGPTFSAVRTAAALVTWAESTTADVERIAAEGADLVLRTQAASSAAEKRGVWVEYLRAHARSRADLVGDVAALGRWMDLDVLRERWTREIADLIDEIDLAYEAVGGLAEQSDEVRRSLVRAGTFESLVRQSEAGIEKPIRLLAMQLLVRLVPLLPVGERFRVLGAGFASRLQAWARSEEEPRWIQVAALKLAVMTFPAAGQELIAWRLQRREGLDGMILRANALRALRLVPESFRVKVATMALDDPSEHVRQTLAQLLAEIATPDCIAPITVLVRDDSQRVAGAALRSLCASAIRSPVLRKTAEAEVLRAMEYPERATVARVAFDSIVAFSRGSPPIVAPRQFAAALVEFSAREESTAELKEAAAALLRWLMVDESPGLRTVRDLFAKTLDSLREGQQARLTLPATASEADVERALAVAAHGDMTVSLKRLGPRHVEVTRGERRAWRLWRVIHEALHPMPDKRKGYNHSAARIPSGETIIAPIGMGEVTPTRVPGERQLLSKFGNWAPFLPRVDDLLAAANLRGKPVRIVTAMGAVTVRGPADLRRRIAARVRVSLRYPKLAALREQSLLATEPNEKRAFGAAAAALGYSVDFAASEGVVDGVPFKMPAALAVRYYAVALPLLLAGLPGWQDVAAYFVSPGGGSVFQLGIVAAIVFAAVVTRAAWIMQSIEAARRSIPLTIGGWGTRGKSGSERLKAALFHAMRCDVVVKTTGCEAMFIHAMRGVAAHEMFIYRPYDKATIWEQRNVLFVGKRLRAQVFLWECMALQPRFVDTLANEWMQDEVTTLTNAYPDHEDIQGPSGEDVARVIGRFMPRGGACFTTEEQMLPLIKDAAAKKGARLHVVEPIEAQLLAQDMLDRLPYQEHPRNVAMVLALAEYYGVDREFAFAEIADYVIADLGVLKTYPEVRYRGRSLIFSNGMSANERAGFMSNWIRLGFDRADPDLEPDVATVVVVNNRADRVARSRVFAQILVDDAAADHVVIINSNLAGMMQFIREALDAKLPAMRVTGDGGTARAFERFDEAMKWLKVPAGVGALRERLLRLLRALPLEESDARALLADAGVEAAIEACDPGLVALLESGLGKAAPDRGPILADVLRHARRYVERLRARLDARAAIQKALDRGDSKEADEIYRRAYRSLFLDRISVLWNTGATGDQVIDFITNEIPPGQKARLMGAQNIKGTGLDFVYRWLAIDKTRNDLARLRRDPRSRQETLMSLSGHTDYGLLDCREALETVRELRAQGGPDWAPHHKLMDGLIEQLAAMEKQKADRLVTSVKSGKLERVLRLLEAGLDHLDSVRRTRFAQKIMRDLFADRIGHGRAALLLREVTGRQKGGWLAKDVAAARQAVRRALRAWLPVRSTGAKVSSKASEQDASAGPS